MKFLLLAVTLVLAGCATNPGVVEAVQQGAARAAGITVDPGSVASGGTGYLPVPCDAPQGATARAGCK